MSTQGNSEAPVYPSNSCNSVYVYVSTSCATVGVGCTLYYDQARTITMPAGVYKVDYANDNKWKFTVDAGGVVTSITRCVWYSNQTYSEMWTGVKNNCDAGSCSVAGSTVTLNDNGNNTYTTGGSYTSYISQVDADSQALTIAYNAFQAGKQGKVNEYGSCTWTYNSGSATYPATSYTKNNCSGGCYGTSVTYGAVTKTGYSAVSTVSCQDAVNTANSSAYNAAQAESQSLGQANANTNGGCCCWVSDVTCSGCNYLGNRQRNTCTGEYRYTEVTAYNSCNCGNTCAGTYYTYSCGGQFNYDQYRQTKNVCDNSDVGSAVLNATCSGSCNASSSPYYENQNYVTCYFCSNVTVYRDINHCSGTNGTYFVYHNGGYVNVGGQPSGVTCNYNSNCIDVGGGYCSGNDYVINRSQNNPCSGESCPPRVIEYNSQTYGCYNPCAGNTSPNYESQGYTTCYNCNNVAVYRDTNVCSSTYLQYYVDYYGYVHVGSQPNGTGCNYGSACTDSGSAYCSGPNWVINQTQTNPCAGSCGVRVIEYNSQSNGCYTPPPTCYTYDLYMYGGTPEYVNVQYTNCGGGVSYLSTYNDGGDGYGGTICARAGTAYIYQGSGALTQQGTCNNT